MNAAKERLLDGLDWLKDRWVEFRARSVFFQVKVGLIGAYALIVAMTVIIFPVPAPDYKVEVSDVNILLTSRTKIVITNLDLGEMHKVQVVVHGTAKGIDGKTRSSVWKSKPNRYWSQGTPIGLEGRDLRDARNFSAPATFQVQKVELFNDGDLIFSHVPGMER